jgi:hypothetical protein
MENRTDNNRIRVNDEMSRASGVSSATEEAFDGAFIAPEDRTEKTPGLAPPPGASNESSPTTAAPNASESPVESSQAKASTSTERPVLESQGSGVTQLESIGTKVTSNIPAAKDGDDQSSTSSKSSTRASFKKKKPKKDRSKLRKGKWTVSLLLLTDECILRLSLIIL